MLDVTPLVPGVMAMSGQLARRMFGGPMRSTWSFEHSTEFPAGKLAGVVKSNVVKLHAPMYQQTCQHTP